MMGYGCTFDCGIGGPATTVSKSVCSGGSSVTVADGAQIMWSGN